MSWHFSRALVAEFSEAICLAGEQSAPSSTTPTPEAFYWPDKTTEHSRLSRFGMTSEPLTDGLGEDLLMWFREDSLVRTSPPLGKASASMASEADFGAKWPGLLAKYDLDSSMWRTAQCSLLEGSDEFSETWPRWGSMRSGVSYLRQMPALPICVSASGLWPTPQASDNRNRGTRKTPAISRRVEAGKQVMLSMMQDGPLNPDWVEWLMGWPIGWTDLTPLETARFQEWQQQHSASYQAKFESEPA